uniref:Uncharacterized protein n=1 Tax=Caenorhabditis tropicalis TaxID=1561998 RepID=A0A1I7V2N5_9PELO
MWRRLGYRMLVGMGKSKALTERESLQLWFSSNPFMITVRNNGKTKMPIFGSRCPEFFGFAGFAAGKRLCCVLELVATTTPPNTFR